MARSLFLFDMTFWLYLASLTLYVAYLFARRPAMAFAPAGHPTEDFDERDGAWATQLGQVATLVTVFGWMVNTAALLGSIQLGSQFRKEASGSVLVRYAAPNRYQ